jgi:DNA-binding transcriptional ArsR family regulator
VNGVDADGLLEAAELFKLLGNASRLRLLLTLERSPCSVSLLAEATGMSQPLVSQHLRSLRQLDLVAARRLGREVVYRVADSHVTHIVGDAVAHVHEIGSTGDISGSEEE